MNIESDSRSASRTASSRFSTLSTSSFKNGISNAFRLMSSSTNDSRLLSGAPVASDGSYSANQGQSDAGSSLFGAGFNFVNSIVGAGNIWISTMNINDALFIIACVIIFRYYWYADCN